MAKYPLPYVAPDTNFALRFPKTYSYGFYLQEEPDAGIDDKNFIQLTLNPQSISMREPIATAVTYTQGGGKYIESRGGLIRTVSISGTTGHLPPATFSLSASATSSVRRGALAPDDPATYELQARYSGFYEFYRLRHLFRKYMFARRKGNTRITMHYFDAKGDDFWRIEPQEFVMSRNARKPFSYDYNISFQCIEPSETDRGVSMLSDISVGGGFIGLPVQAFGEPTQRGITQLIPLVGGRRGTPGISTRPDAPSFQQVLNRMKTQRYSGLGFLKYLSGAAQRAFQNLLRRVNNVVGFFEDLYSTFTTIIETPLVLLRQLDASIRGWFAVMELYTADNLQRELNEWALEMWGMNDYLLAYSVESVGGVGLDVQRQNEKFARGRGKRGATTDLLVEPSGSTGSPDFNPFLGESGLSLITDLDTLETTTSYTQVAILDGETIYALALRLLGDIQRFIDLVFINGLEYPYIVADATNKPSNTLAWGEFINIPSAPTDTLVDAEEMPPLAPSFSHTVTLVGLPVEVIDEDLSTPWRENQWIGYTVTITVGGIDESRVVVANTADTLTVNRAWTTPPTVGTPYVLTLELFDARRPVTPEARAYGKDVLLAFTPATGNPYSDLTADIVLSPTGDLAVVRGVENLFQSITLRFQTEQGRHPFHPLFGVSAPVGRAWSENTLLLYTYFMRQSLLRDPRIEQVKNTELAMQNGVVEFTANIQPIQTRKTRLFRVSVR